jgi:hypothetical protein
VATGRIGVTPVLGTRWSIEPAAGTTSLSGLDANSVSLVYSVGYEQVYRNGVLLSRGNDYTATSGTSITLTDATIAGDIIEVFAQELVPLTDAISKGQFTAKGSLLSASAASTPAVLAVGTNGQVLKADSSTTTGLAWGADTSGLTLIKTASFSNVADTGTTFDNVFSSSYDSYKVVIQGWYGATDASDPQFQFRYAGPTTQADTNRWRYAQTDGTAWTSFGTSATGPNLTAITLAERNGATAGYGSAFFIDLTQILSTGSRPYMTWTGFIEDEKGVFGAGYQYTSRTYTGLLFKSSSGNIYGTVSIYGLAK